MYKPAQNHLTSAGFVGKSFGPRSGACESQGSNRLDPTTRGKQVLLPTRLGGPSEGDPVSLYQCENTRHRKILNANGQVPKPNTRKTLWALNSYKHCIEQAPTQDPEPTSWKPQPETLNPKCLAVGNHLVAHVI